MKIFKLRILNINVNKTNNYDSMESKLSLLKGLLKIPLAVLIVTARTTPSSLE